MIIRSFIIVIALLVNFSQVKSQSARIDSLENIGRVLFKQKRYCESLFYLGQTLEKGRLTNDLRLLAEVHGIMAECFAKKENFNEAVNAQALSIAYRDSASWKEHKEMLTQMIYKYEILKRENEISVLFREIEKNKKITFSIGAIFIFSIILLSILFFVKNKRLKETRKQIEAEKIKSEFKLKKITLKERDLTMKIEIKSEELTGLVHVLSTKNEMLEEIKSKLEMIKRTVDPVTRTMVARLLRNVHYSRQANKDWDSFRIYFEKLHENFFRGLKEVFPHLKLSDLKLCTLLRLNLDAAEIANIMEISPQSVRVMIHRLRKKLSVKNDLNLFTFLSTFDPLVEGFPVDGNSMSTGIT